MKKILLITVFCSFAIGTYAQCDSVVNATFEMSEDHISLDPSLLYPTGTTPPEPPGPDTSEVRRIYFIHGLGGTAGAWEKAAIACADGSLNIPGFPARKCETIRTDYTNSTASLYSAADDVRIAISIQANNDRTYTSLDPSRAILIGHSQGGLVIRQLMHLDMVKPGTSGTGHSSLANGMNYGGVVTFASSLQGAQIVNNRNMITQMAQEACNKLVLGFEKEAIYSTTNMLNSLPDKIKFMGFTIVTLEDVKNSLKQWISNTLGSVAEGGCSMLANTALPMFFNSMYAGTTNDYKIGASMIDTMNLDTNNTEYKAFPKMAFYAVEPQENIFWRTLNWLVNDPNAANIDYFQANDDWYLYDSTIKPMINYYQVKCALYYCLYDLHSYAISKVKKKDQLSQFQAAVNALITYAGYSIGLEWFNNANESWKTIIGARVQNGNTVTYKDENDGVVLAESAANLPKATHGPIKIYGSSHMQIRNDDGLKTHLNKLFNGDYDKWFKVFEQ